MPDILVVSDEKTVYRVLGRSGNVVVPAEACRPLAGFVPDTFSEYRNRSIVRERLHCANQAPSTLGLSNTFVGRYYLAVAMQDSSVGDEPFELWMGNRKLADVSATANDNRVHLWVVRKPLHLKRGESFRLVTAANGRPYRIECIALLGTLPRPAPRRPAGRLPFTRHRRGPGVKAGSVALTFGGGATAPAAQFPLTTGIPLPIGHLYDPARVALLGAGRQPLEVQTRAIGFWPDGSIRWLLLDFQHDLGVSDSHVVLRYGRDLPRQSAPRALAAEADGGIDIDTGAARLRVPERRPFLPGEVRLAGGGPVTAGGGSAGIHIESAAGSIYTSRGAADTVVIEEAGPLRAVVRLEFRHRDSRGRVLFRSTARIHAYAGKSWFRVGYTFTNDNTEAAFTSIRRLVLATPVPSPPDASAYVLQDLDNHFTYGSDGQNRKEGRRHSGLLLARTGFGACAVAVRDFWQNYPKAIGLGPHGIEVGICPDVSGVNYRVGGYEEDRLFYYLADGAYRFRCGMSRTHDLFYGFAPEGEAAELRRQARAFLTPPVVRARPAVYVRSGAVGQMASPSGATGFYERWLTSARGRFLADRKARRAYGMMNYGDWFGERRYNWGNMEYDTPWVFLNEFLRGGHAQWFELAFRAAQHLVDVDTCHASPGAETVGGQYGHCMGHVGGYYPPGYREASTAVGGMSRDHTWVEGLFLHHSLTGDVRFQEAARTACDRMAEEVDARTFDFSNCRDAGWLLIHLCAGYTATLERRYLEAAHVVVERVIERQRASGGWERMMVPGHCYCDPPRHMGNAAFMVGVLMAGLKRYHLITQDPQVRRCILRAARYAVAAYWVEGQRVFRYTNCPYIWVHVSMNPQMVEGLGYAWRLSRSPEIGRALIGAMERCFGASPEEEKADRHLPMEVPGYPRRVFDAEDGGVGKSISLAMRQAPFALFDYQKAKA